MRILAILPLLALAACEQPAAQPAGPAPDKDLCKQASYQGLVGQTDAVLRTLMLPAGSRVIGPSDAVTADYRPDRLNIETGTDHRITKIACY